MRTKYAPLLSDLFLRAYETYFFIELLNNKDRKLDNTLNSSYRYIDDVLSLNTARFGGYLQRIYPKMSLK